MLYAVGHRIAYHSSYHPLDHPIEFVFHTVEAYLTINCDIVEDDGISTSHRLAMEYPKFTHLCHTSKHQKLLCSFVWQNYCIFMQLNYFIRQIICFVQQNT